MAKILPLTLFKKWFIEILKGKKKIEYREIKPYWTKRLFNYDGTPKKYDYIMSEMLCENHISQESMILDDCQKFFRISEALGCG